MNSPPDSVISQTLANTTLVTSTASTQTATTTPQPTTSAINNNASPTVTSSTCIPNTPTTNVVTIPVPIVHNEEIYAYVCVKGSLHDRSCSVFGLNETEVQAIVKRFENSVKPLINGIMVSVPPMAMINSLAELGYKVVTSCGEADISWTMQRET